PLRGARRGRDPRRGLGAGRERAVLAQVHPDPRPPARPDRRRAGRHGASGGLQGRDRRGRGRRRPRHRRPRSSRRQPQSSMMRGTAIAFTARDRIETVGISIPALQPEEVLIETELTAVSQGTDRAMVAGRYRGVTDRYPFIYGYSRVGRVIETGP